MLSLHNVNNCHCEEFDDVAIGVQLRMTIQIGQHCLCRKRRRPYRVVEDCHVVELLAMTKWLALPLLASTQPGNNLYGKYT